MKYKIDVMYRDACNYKDYITIERDSDKYPIVATLKEGQEEVLMSDIGITLESFEMIQEYGEGKDDHCFVEIEVIELIS